jgi:hypothetical protein
MRGRIRAACDGLGWYIGPAVVLLVFALLSFLLIAQSRTDRLLWTGAKVVGQERQGLVYYTYRGQTDTLDVPGFRSARHYVVYVDKSDPSIAEAESTTTRVTDEMFILGPVILAAAMLALGVVRRRSQRNRPLEDYGFGQGLDPEFVRRQLDQLRSSQPPDPRT